MFTEYAWWCQNRIESYANVVDYDVGGWISDPRMILRGKLGRINMFLMAFDAVHNFMLITSVIPDSPSWSDTQRYFVIWKMWFADLSLIIQLAKKGNFLEKIKILEKHLKYC